MLWTWIPAHHTAVLRALCFGQHTPPQIPPQPVHYFNQMKPISRTGLIFSYVCFDMQFSCQHSIALTMVDIVLFLFFSKNKVIGAVIKGEKFTGNGACCNASQSPWLTNVLFYWIGKVKWEILGLERHSRACHSRKLLISWKINKHCSYLLSCLCSEQHVVSNKLNFLIFLSLLHQLIY